MRSSEKQKQIDKCPEFKLIDIKNSHGSGQVNFTYKDCAKLWKQCIVKRGVVRYWIYGRPDKNGKQKLIKYGVEK